jgi:hypothetical protein
MTDSNKVFRGGINNWQSHLNALCAVATRAAQVSLTADTVADHGGLKHVFNFQLANLFWFDIIGSSSRGMAPSTPYREWAVGWGAQTSTIMGCQSRIMAIIGDITCLTSRQDVQVIHDGLEIQKRLDSILAELSEDTQVGMHCLIKLIELFDD